MLSTLGSKLFFYFFKTRGLLESMVGKTLEDIEKAPNVFLKETKGNKERDRGCYKMLMFQQVKVKSHILKLMKNGNDFMDYLYDLGLSMYVN